MVGLAILPRSRGLSRCVISGFQGIVRIERKRKLLLTTPDPIGEQMKEIRILIADESAFVRRRVRSILGDQQSWRIVGEAAAEADLLAKATEETPDIVIMDTATPVLGGLDAAKKILELRPDVKIIVLSLEDDGALVWCVLRAGGRGYILKPEFSRNLEATVRSVCSGQLV